MTVTSHFVYFRQIDRLGVIQGHWCSCPKLGYIRTESGLLYKDNGTNNKIYHAANYIPKDNEFRHLSLSIVPASSNDDDDLFDDELPPEFMASSEVPPRSGPDPLEARLRYARLMHNTIGGKVVSRPHLIGDIIGMQDDELNSFLDEDPETASVVFAELVSMVLQFNQELWDIDPNNPSILNADEVVRIGQPDYHMEAMKEITKARRGMYEDQINRLNEIIDGEEEVHVA